MKTLCRLALDVYDYLVFYVGLGACGLVFFGWSLLALGLRRVLPPAIGQRLGRLATMWIFRAALGLLRMSGRFDFDLNALDGLRGERGLIIAPNHPSLWDAMMILSRLPDVACVMKAEIAANLFIGAGALLARHIQNTSLRWLVRAAVDSLQSGSQLLIFPEGTRSVREPVNPFTASIGLIAARSGASVQTVLIETESEYLRKGWPIWRKPVMPVVYQVRLGKRFAPVADSAELVMELEAYFRHQLAHRCLTIERCTDFK